MQNTVQNTPVEQGQLLQALSPLSKAELLQATDELLDQLLLIYHQYISALHVPCC